MDRFKYLDVAIDDMAANHDVFASEMGGERVNALLAAARVYRDLANGERVEWCEEHGASSDDEATPMGAVACWKALKGLGDSNDCRIVSRLLVDYPKEAENEH